MQNCNKCHSGKLRSAEEKNALTNRLKRIEGQVRGLCAMVERDEYCVDILTQLSAVRSALDSFSVVLLDSHLKSCVKEDIMSGRDDVLDELTEVIARMVK